MRYASTILKAAFISGVLLALGTGLANAAATGTVTGNNVNVRREASTDSEIYKRLDNGIHVSVVGKSNGWYTIACADESTAYIYEDYLRITQADGAVAGDNVNVRSAADTNAEVLSQLQNGDSVTVVGQTGTWYLLKFDGSNAYVHKDYVSGDLLEDIIEEGTSFKAEEKKYAQVTAETGLNVRADASLDAPVVELLSNNTSAEIIEEHGDWIQVKTTSGKVGFVSSEFVSITTTESTNLSLAQQIIAFGKQYMGTPYKWGGTNLSTGVDCSGFVYSVMKQFGINLNRSSASMVNNGTPVEKSNLQMGDLVFFDTTGPNDGGISHVGIYISGGDYIHSSSGAAWGVTISNLNEDYSARTYVTARRVL